ncbi:MAG: hypothetical protein A2Y45_00500 [Tenericutes bacterium GWC2_34_14]|nr:MAG: hypothetical protein A2Y45_00500 [Tenericutes bacterium GWC2_34_14]OHE34480.1 MAG: hypothetical protein A2012_08120 [Tenericutes bacterium GWE2_34_108]OHE35836.1 MAG: hypothetical protein A2Y46_02825 [Tenericutes bacterium GWF1_35_14]OHE39077.1 MAG: hypothetical protein A2Y44_07105 [Tenericutes bacterium GWF2_35_184]OHE42856.1 MAG: hypothetical protein A2221_09130 [Tenericutes bacterium RIFOXYA2_FULL_36_32]OHE46084.1 MAG: hypothetical protein A2308_00800 [Tenericutes bacterium RIFOXYB2
MEKLPVTLVIPTMNRPDDLMNTITSFLSQVSIPSEIIVVDQTTTNDDRIKITTFLNGISNLDIIYTFQDFPSLPTARNKGMILAKYDIVIFSDDDILLIEDTLFNTYKLLSNDRIAMIGGSDINAKKNRSFLGYLTFHKSFFKRSIGHVSFGLYGRFPNVIKSLTRTQWAMGFYFGVKKSFCQSHDVRWDEKLLSYAYPEDLIFSFEYYKKAKANKLECYFSDTVKVKHMASQTSRLPKFKTDLLMVINRGYMIYKFNLGFRYKLGFHVSNYATLFSRLKNRENFNQLLSIFKIYKENIENIKSGSLEHIYSRYLNV